MKKEDKKKKMQKPQLTVHNIAVCMSKTGCPVAI